MLHKKDLFDEMLKKNATKIQMAKKFLIDSSKRSEIVKQMN